MSVSLQDWLQSTTVRLANSFPASEPEPQARARQELLWLLESRAGLSRTDLLLRAEQPLNASVEWPLEEAVKRLCQGEPLAYVLGEQPFWSLLLKVSPKTLIPRADTEILVAEALALPLPEDAQVLDLGTGTGAIALALASEMPGWQVTAVDVVPEAVRLARENAQRHDLSNVQVLEGSWYEPLPRNKQFHLICSNPPYIEQGDPHLCAQVSAYEPATALIAADGGLADIEHILEGSQRHLVENGWILIEHGWEQASAVSDRFEQYGFLNIRTLQDLAGRDRATLGRKA